jgi:hypothetical protein
MHPQFLNGILKEFKCLDVTSDIVIDSEKPLGSNN